MSLAQYMWLKGRGPGGYLASVQCLQYVSKSGAPTRCVFGEARLARLFDLARRGGKEAKRLVLVVCQPAAVKLGGLVEARLVVLVWAIGHVFLDQQIVAKGQAASVGARDTYLVLSMYTAGSFGSKVMTSRT